MEETKVCPACELVLPKSSFAKKLDGLQARCRECHALYTRKHYAENKVYYKEKARKAQVKLYAWLKELKFGKPCVRCGHVGHFAAMHWHHLGDKEFNISEAARRYGRAKIEQELEKCELLCADCHAVETWGPMPLESDG